MPMSSISMPVKVVLGLIVVAALWLTWFSSSFANSVLLSRAMPQRAVAAMRTAPALAAQAGALVMTEKPDRDQVRQAHGLALEALRREPGNVFAVRTLGLIEGYQGNPRAKQWMLHAERLSRRDAPAQLWLIEEAVRENDVARALVHYDRVLSTSFSSREILLPILVKAASEPDIADRLSRRIAQRPNWWEKAVTKFIEASEDAPSLALVLHRLRLNPDIQTEREYLTAGLARLVSRGGLIEAAQIVRSVRPASAASTQAGIDRFEQDPVLPPFDWRFSSDPDLSAARVSADGAGPGGFRIDVAVGEGKTGPVASRLLMLKPGAYQLSSRVDGEPDTVEALAFTIACQGRSKDGRANPLVTVKGNTSAAFTVPATGCEGQWVSIVKNIQRNYDPNGRGAQVHEIRIARAR